MSAADAAGVIAAAANQRDAMRALLPLFAEAGIAEAEAELAAIWREASRGGVGWTDETRSRFARFVAGRLNRIPLDRLVGERGFWTLDLALNAATLSPRADTETLVQAALARLRKQGRGAEPVRILDLGTGSGAILLALLAELPAATGLGVDLSAEAVAMARENATRNGTAFAGLSARAEFRVSDWFSALDGVFDLIVSNPPYIRSADIAGLEPEVRLHDPLLALDGGRMGLPPIGPFSPGRAAISRRALACYWRSVVIKRRR